MALVALATIRVRISMQDENEVRCPNVIDEAVLVVFRNVKRPRRLPLPSPLRSRRAWQGSVVITSVNNPPRQESQQSVMIEYEVV